MRFGALALLLCSCSWISVTPPAQPPQSPGECTTSQTAPSLDLLMIGLGAAGVVFGGWLISDASGHRCQPGVDQNCESYGAEAGFGVLVAVPSALIALAYGLSAHYGFGNVALCRDAKSRAGLR
jgi:hypothetical protein